MDIIEISELLYSYTSGYPYLVSGLCKLMDEEIPKENPLFSDKSSAWTRDGFLKAVKKMLYEQSPLFDSLTGKLYEYPEIQMAKMFGFVKEENSSVVIANRIFETRLYNMFLTLSKEQEKDIYAESSRQKNQFMKNGHLDMKLILENF